MFKNVVHRDIFHQSGSPTFQESKWGKIDESTREQIKGALLSNLGDNAQGDPKFMKDLCQCLAAIAVVELPMDMWAEFIGMMCQQGDQNQNENFKMAAVQCLGFIIEDLPSSFLKEEYLQLIWNTMLNQTKSQNTKMLQIVASALIRLAPTAKRHFAMPEARQKIMQSVFELLNQ